MLDLLVFSKDRPAQLELLLRSMRRFFPEYRDQRVSVVYTASTAAFDDGYALLRGEYPEVRWVDERSGLPFREATLSLLGHRPFTAFMVDDNVFRTPFSLSVPELEVFMADPEILCLSLRMAPWMDYCYPLDRRTPPPAFERGTVWRWMGAEGDWGYPMSADGHIFRTAEIAPLVAELPFANPNTLEAALAAHPLPSPKAICLPESVIVNNPANRVQDVARNRSGSVSPEWLNGEFLAGGRLSIEPFIGLRNPSPHHELAYEWEEAGAAPRVSVVIPCFNYGHHLAEAVESVLGQTLRDLEVVIVDDGSTDDSAEVARRLIAEHPERDVRLLSQANSGHPARARNAGIARSRAEYVLCLDADDALEPGFLEACVGVLERDPGAGIAYGDARLVYEEEGGAGRARYLGTGEWDAERLLHANVIGTASVFRRAAWEAVGGYDPEVGYEDWDLWIGIAERGWHGVKVPGAMWRYRVHGQGRYAKDTAEDRRIKARFVLKRPELYSAEVVEWAREGLGRAVEDGRIPAGAAPGKAVTVGDLRMEVPADMAWAFSGSDFYEGNVAAWFDALVVAGDAPVVYDIGANYGYFSLRGASSAAHTYSFEPVERTFEVLRRNLLGTGLRTVTPLSVGLSDVDERRTINLYSSSGNNSLWVRDLPAGHPLHRTGEEVVHVMPLDRVVAERGLRPPTVVKVDVEGAELAVLRGARQTLLRHRPAILMEYGETTSRDAGYPREDLVEELRELGYDVYGLAEDPADLTAHPPVAWQGREIANLVAVPGGSPLPELGVPRTAIDVRSFATVAYADEIVEDPDLLRAYATAFHDDDDATLVLYAPGADAVALGARLEPALAAAGLDSAPAPDLMALAVAPEEGDPALARGASAVLSRRPADGPLGSLPAFGPAEVPALRALAERSWGMDRMPEAPPSPPLTPEEQFAHDLAAYQAMPGAEPIYRADLNPQLLDRLPTSPYDPHYFYQDIWAARRVAEFHPERHVDVGSRVDYAGQLTSVTKVTFVDIRPLEVELDDFESVAGSILDLPFADRSLESVSCLHVAEHIGLGRYGDPLDPLGTKKAARELERVLAPGGRLLFSGPVGRSRLCFNAHRVHDPYEVLAMFPQLELVEFSGVDDHGVFRRHRSLDELVGSEYACGMFLLRRPPIRGMYSQLVRAGDLVFDVGANLGNRTEAFLALGARVVAIEPQPECVEHLRRRWPDEDRLTVVPAAVSDSEGEGELFVSEASTLTSMAPEWIEAIVASGRFSGYSWDQRITVPTTTLTRLVAEHGRPAFCKIDVEGFEAKVLEGLDQPLPAVSLEFAKEALHMTRRCVERLMELGPTEFNFSLGESLEWALPRWVSGPELLAALERLPDEELPWGDVYARAASSEEHGPPSS